MDEIKSYLELGIISDVFDAKRHLFIWEQIASEYDVLIEQKEEVQRLYSYLQRSAQSNFILHTTRVFDKPDRNYPTRSIKSFLTLILKNLEDFPAIVETVSTKEELEKYNAPPELIASINSADPKLFPKLFHDWVLKKYDSPEIKVIREDFSTIRSKYIAHNEHIDKAATIDIEKLKLLLAFATEILQVFSKAYYYSHYNIDGDVERNCFFIVYHLNILKGQQSAAIDYPT